MMRRAAPPQATAGCDGVRLATAGNQAVKMGMQGFIYPSREGEAAI
jgi:hypothetical protein